MTTALVLDLGTAFKSAGYDAGSFTDDEKSRISTQFSKLLTAGRSKIQALLVSISMCAPAKAKGSAAGTFAAVNDGVLPPPAKIQIRGGAYRWHDDLDGYFTIFDVPLMSTVAKGVKDAPYDVDEPELNRYVQVAQERYQLWNYCATAFVNHNKDLELVKPEFAGYVLPNRVGPCMLEDEQGTMVEKPAVYGDLKVNRATFEKIRRGELPYHSPEVPWAKRRISGLAFLDTKPPFFEFANLTLGDEVKDVSYANFSGVPVENIKRELVGKFDGGGDAEGDGSTQGLLKKLMGRMDAFEADAKARYSAFEGQFAAIKKKFEGEAEGLADTKVASTGRPTPGPGAIPAPGTSEPTLKGKADGEGEGEGDAEADAKATKKKGTFSKIDPKSPLPIEPDKRTAPDPAFAAQFEALSATVKQMKAAADSKDAEIRRKERVDKALGELRGKIYADTLPGTLAQFADDEAGLNKVVAELKKSLPSEPPGSMADFKGQAVDQASPSVAAFAAQGPEAAQKAASFAADYRRMKSLKWPISRTEEEYVKFHMESGKGLSA